MLKTLRHLTHNLSFYFGITDVLSHNRFGYPLIVNEAMEEGVIGLRHVPSELYTSQGTLSIPRYIFLRREDESNGAMSAMGI
jgi:hypothetical protein